MSAKFNPRAFIFVGPSGGGKGTQTQLLIDALKKRDSTFGFIHIETGKELRKFIQGKSLTQELSHELYVTDKLQPEFTAILMWANILSEKYTGNEHLIFDGSPRRIIEAHVLESAFSFYGFKRPIVVYLRISHEEAMARLLKRKRQDDGEDSIRKRLAWYEENVTPTVDYYRKSSVYDFWDIDGGRSIAEVHADIVKRAGLV